jgi:hypothetical protein
MLAIRRTRSPLSMTPGRATLLLVVQRYIDGGGKPSLLEVQKLAYLLSCAGVLRRFEGHFTVGFKGQYSRHPIQVLPEAVAEARYACECVRNQRGVGGNTKTQRLFCILTPEVFRLETPK